MPELPAGELELHVDVLFTMTWRVDLECWFKSRLENCFLAGLFATSGYSGKASGRFFGGFGGDFPVVFGLLPDENSEKNSLKSL